MQISNANFECKLKAANLSGKFKEQIGMVMRLGESGILWGTLVRYFSWGNQGGPGWGDHPGREPQRRL